MLKKIECLSSSQGKSSNREKAQIIYALRHDFKIIELVKFAKIPRSSYYYHLKLIEKPDKYKEVKEKILQIFEDNKKRVGYRRITMEMY